MINKKQNCWEFKNCHRQPGIEKVNDKGLCRATTNFTFNGRNDGVGSGRYCWRIAGTLCEGKAQGSFAEKIDNCMNCDFFKLVKLEEGTNFIQ